MDFEEKTMNKFIRAFFTVFAIWSLSTVSTANIGKNPSKYVAWEPLILVKCQPGAIVFSRQVVFKKPSTRYRIWVGSEVVFTAYFDYEKEPTFIERKVSGVWEYPNPSTLTTESFRVMVNSILQEYGLIGLEEFKSCALKSSK